MWSVQANASTGLMLCPPLLWKRAVWAIDFLSFFTSPEACVESKRVDDACPPSVTSG